MSNESAMCFSFRETEIFSVKILIMHDANRSIELLVDGRMKFKIIEW